MVGVSEFLLFISQSAFVHNFAKNFIEYISNNLSSQSSEKLFHYLMASEVTEFSWIPNFNRIFDKSLSQANTETAWCEMMPAYLPLTVFRPHWRHRPHRRRQRECWYQALLRDRGISLTCLLSADSSNSIIALKCIIYVVAFSLFLKNTGTLHFVIHRSLRSLFSSEKTVRWWKRKFNLLSSRCPALPRPCSLSAACSLELHRILKTQNIVAGNKILFFLYINSQMI